MPVENSLAPEVVYTRAESMRRRRGQVLRRRDVHESREMKQIGLSVSANSELTGYGRKTVRKYLLYPEGVPSYGPRPPQLS